MRVLYMYVCVYVCVCVCIYVCIYIHKYLLLLIREGRCLAWDFYIASFAPSLLGQLILY